LLADRIVPLGAGPGAVLGPALSVAIARPRDRRTINHDPQFKAVRNAIIAYLTGPGGRQRRAAAAAATAASPAWRRGSNCMKRPHVEISHLTKSFPGREGHRGPAAVIVDDFDLRVDEGEFVCLIGHSGCGKSTVLSVMAVWWRPRQAA